MLLRRKIGWDQLLRASNDAWAKNMSTTKLYLLNALWFVRSRERRPLSLAALCRWLVPFFFGPTRTHVFYSLEAGQRRWYSC